MRRIAVLVPLVVVALLTGCVASSFNMSGHLTLQWGAFNQPDPAKSSCVALTGYDDISTGVQVVIADDAGKTVAVGKLGSGKMTKNLDGCAFPFRVSDVPSGSKFYKVTVSHRGGIEFTEKELRSGPALTLG